MHLPETAGMMRALIRSRPSKATKTLTIVALCLVAALVLVSQARMDSQVRGMEQFTAGDAR